MVEKSKTSWSKASGRRYGHLRGGWEHLGSGRRHLVRRSTFVFVGVVSELDGLVSEVDGLFSEVILDMGRSHLGSESS